MSETIMYELLFSQEKAKTSFQNDYKDNKRESQTNQ